MTTTTIQAVTIATRLSVDEIHKHLKALERSEVTVRSEVAARNISYELKGTLARPDIETWDDNPHAPDGVTFFSFSVSETYKGSAHFSWMEASVSGGLTEDGILWVRIGGQDVLIAPGDRDLAHLEVVV